jgi:hypothetical protein
MTSRLSATQLGQLCQAADRSEFCSDVWGWLSGSDFETGNYSTYRLFGPGNRLVDQAEMRGVIRNLRCSFLPPDPKMVAAIRNHLPKLPASQAVVVEQSTPQHQTVSEQPVPREFKCARCIMVLALAAFATLLALRLTDRFPINESRDIDNCLVAAPLVVGWMLGCCVTSRRTTAVQEPAPAIRPAAAPAARFGRKTRPLISTQEAESLARLLDQTLEQHTERRRYTQRPVELSPFDPKVELGQLYLAEDLFETPEGWASKPTAAPMADEEIDKRLLELAKLVDVAPPSAGTWFGHYQLAEKHRNVLRHLIRFLDERANTEGFQELVGTILINLRAPYEIDKCPDSYTPTFDSIYYTHIAPGMYRWEVDTLHNRLKIYLSACRNQDLVAMARQHPVSEPKLSGKGTRIVPLADHNEGVTGLDALCARYQAEFGLPASEGTGYSEAAVDPLKGKKEEIAGPFRKQLTVDYCVAKLRHLYLNPRGSDGKLIPDLQAWLDTVYNDISLGFDGDGIPSDALLQTILLKQGLLTTDATEARFAAAQ